MELPSLLKHIAGVPGILTKRRALVLFRENLKFKRGLREN